MNVILECSKHGLLKQPDRNCQPSTHSSWIDLAHDLTWQSNGFFQLEPDIPVLQELTTEI